MSDEILAMSMPPPADLAVISSADTLPGLLSCSVLLSFSNAPTGLRSLVNDSICLVSIFKPLGVMSFICDIIFSGLFLS